MGLSDRGALHRLPGRGLGPRLAVCSLLIAALSPAGDPARAASTGTTALFMPQGSGAVSQFGDYITSNNPTAPATPLNTVYRYFIEVPAGLARLRVQIFDADVGAGAGEDVAQRDRSRGTFSTSAKYTLIRPNGTTAATQTCTATATAFCADNAWSSLLDSTTDTAAGHWELDVDQSSAVTAGSDINAIGIRADDGDATSGGTEIPVYYAAHAQYGENPPGGATPGTKNYTFYPYVTSGCSFTENDFDYDLGNGGAGQNVGSIGFASRSGSFTKNFAAASLSANNVWQTNSVSGWTTDADSIDYGVWKMTPAISNYCTPTPCTASAMNGNYANVYVANFQSAGGAPANNSPTPNTFRVYLPTDGGTAPVKSYMEQLVRWFSGPKTPTVGSTTVVQVTVRVVDPAAQSIAFSASNLVTANVPAGGGATYAGSAAVSQGTITAQPAVGGTGNITWNPGTLAAGGTALLTYRVNVTPTSAGQRIPVTATPASGNGTRGTWVDETGNTTQARSTLTFGPLCELALTQGLITAAEVVDLHATASGPGSAKGVIVEWQTAAEIGAAGFDLYRFEPAAQSWRKVNRTLVPSLSGAPQGGTYRVLDEEAPAGAAAATLRYMVVETEINGATRNYPFHVAVEPPGEPLAVAAAAGGAASGEPAAGGAAATLQETGWERSPRRDPAAEERGRLEGAGDELQGAAAAPGLMTASSEDAGKASLKIGVRENGLYRLDAAVIAKALGAPVKEVADRIAGHGYALSNQGRAVAWAAESGGQALSFYGQAIHSIYSRDNVYWLRRGDGLAIENAGGGRAESSSASPLASFTDTVHSEQDVFAGTAIPADPESDYWYWDFLIGGDAANGTKSFTAAAPGVNAGGGSLAVHLKGATDTHHHVRVSLNGAVLGETSWSGIADQSASFAVSGLSAGGGNTVSLTALADPGAGLSVVYVNNFDLTYERGFRALGDALAFRGSGNARVTVTGFSGVPVRVFDLTDPLRPRLVRDATVELEGKGGGAHVTLRPATPSTPYLAVGPAAVRSAQWVKLATLATSSGLLERPSGADYLVLTSTELVQAASSLAALRASQGLRTAVVDVGDVYDVLGFGLPNPHAIQAFLAYVHARWSPAPRYLVLAGDGNYDYRNLLGYGGNLVPPLMVSTDSGLFAADNHLADVNGDGVPDFAVGRLPVASAAELNAYVQKLSAFEGAAGSGWANRALLLADAPGPNDGVTSFAADSNTLAKSLPAGYAPQQIDVAQGIAGARSALFAGLGAGAGLVNFLGHAGLDRLSPQSLLTSGDVASLANGPRLPVMAALSCNVNRFDVPGFSSLGEVLARQSGAGAVAVWSASGLSFHPEGKELARLFYLALANPANHRLGDAMREALTRYAQGQAVAATLDLYTLLGDPAVLLKPVAPEPPAGPTSTVKE